MSVDFSQSPLYNAIRRASQRRPAPSLHTRALILAISANTPDIPTPRATKSRQHKMRARIG